MENDNSFFKTKQKKSKTKKVKKNNNKFVYVFFLFLNAICTKFYLCFIYVLNQNVWFGRTEELSLSNNKRFGLRIKETK